MLQTIREHTQGWIAKAVITIIILTFALWGIHSYFVSDVRTNVVAKVNGTEISKEQLTVAYERLRRQAQVQYGNNGNPKNDAGLKDKALQSLVEIETLRQASINQGFLISDQQIDNYLQSMPEFQVDGQFSLDRFQEVLASTLMSTSDFLELIKTSLLIEQPRLGILFTSIALPDETAYTVSLVNQEREISYINIPTQYFLVKPIVVSPEKIQAYYNEHKQDFMTPEQMNVEYVELSLKDLAANMQPADAALKNFYNENVNSYTLPMAWKVADVTVASSTADAESKAKAVSESLKKGANIADLVKQNESTITSTDWMTLNQVPVDLQKTVATMLKANEVSAPIKTSKGYVVLKIVAVREPKIQTFEEVKDKVKEIYVRQRAEEQFAQLRDQLADMTYEHPESLQLASKSLNLKINTSESFSKDKAGKDISQYKKVRDIAFSNDVLNLQNNSDVIQITPDTVIVLRAKSHVASTLLPLADISNQIADKLKAQTAEEQTASLANDIKAKLAAGADPVALAKANQLTWTTTGFLGRYATKIDPAILDIAFRLPNPANNQNKTVYGVTRLPTGYAVIGLKSVKNGEIADESQYAVFAEQVQNSEGLLEYELYKQSQLKNAKIER